MQKNHILRVLAAGTLVFCSALAAESKAALAKFEPPDGTTYFGYYIPGYQSDAGFDQSLAKHATQISSQPFTLLSMFIHSQEKGVWNTWSLNQTPDGVRTTPAGAYVERVRARGFVPVVAWTWMNYADPEHSPDLKGVPLGKYDWYLDDWIAGVKKFNTPIFIRLSHEMNGNWFPYSPSYVKNPHAVTTGDYVNYWRYVVDRFRKAGVANVAWVWCVNGDYRAETPSKLFYPGDSYVDWLSVDVYSALSARSVLEHFIQEFGTEKPIMIPEGGTSKSVTKWYRNFVSNTQWTNELFDLIDVDFSPQIKGFCWFEDFSTGSMVDDPSQLAAFQTRIAKPRYQKTSTPSVPPK
jgi:hypothetical protein